VPGRENPAFVEDQHCRPALPLIVQGGCKISGDADSRSPWQRRRSGPAIGEQHARRGGLDVSPALLSGQEPLQGQPEYVRAAAQAMLGGDEVAADEHREGEHAANLDLLLVGAESAE
jgi:hypothetical protein